MSSFPLVCSRVINPTYSSSIITIARKGSLVLSPVQDIVFELCAETLDTCLLAKSSGASRIELCADLNVDGLTPSHALVQQAVQLSGVPIFMLLRPRAGNFVYTAPEFNLIREDLLHGKSLGVSGFAVGVLHQDGTVDIERTRELVALAAPLEVTFHRAFDVTPSLPQALEDVIRTGSRRILTSGGAPDVFLGADSLTNLVHLAANRIEIAAGGGLRAEGAAALVSTTGARHFHGSVRLHNTSAVRLIQVASKDVQHLVSSLQRGTIS